MSDYKKSLLEKQALKKWWCLFLPWAWLAWPFY